jgi:hypothetical protein
MMNLKDSNQYIIDLINTNKSFTITRCSSESYPSYLYSIKKQFFIPGYISNNAGIYSNDNQDIAIFYINHINSIIESNGLAIYLERPDTTEIENFFISNNEKLNLKFIHFKVLEPFYCILENITPWTHHLLGKKILVISPFVDSFQKQLTNGFSMFKDTNNSIFLPNQEFVFYKCFNTVAGNHLHSNWIETINIMCNDISKLDFDIALISCGGYALLLGSFIKNKMNKSAIYIGGGLQLFFGVAGKRWDTNETIQSIIKENGCNYIRPSNDEIPTNCQNVEGGCYW